MGIIKKMGILLIIIMGILIAGIFIPPIFTVLGDFFYGFFNEWVVWIYIGIFSVGWVVGCATYGFASAYIKYNRLKGTLITMFGTLLVFIGALLSIIYTFFTILFTSLITIELKLILLAIFVLAAAPFLLLSLEKCLDITTFMKDIWNQRKEFYKLTYTSEEEGNLIYIHIQKNDSNVSDIHEAAATLKIQEAAHALRISPAAPISVYIKSAFLIIFTELTRNFTAWPRARNRIYRGLAKVRIAKNACIGQWTRIDPLFPDLIELEEGSGVGIGCNLLSHNFIHDDPLTICIGSITIKKNARVGAYSTILPGVTIGEGAIVGAGSVVVDDIPPNTIAYGVPATVVNRKSVSQKEKD